ncbi:hypothetical protein NQ317_013633 [Molorchus minor]|uniref:Reverse transcriptase zinc-binding domain-containing protein n=1 Tax=Molorchus minor TaxID=1323400 RepID=A0ABQ9JUK1_9CUCU|nr:hypothetical protein NQ317_013633 [Molorchus minor]
MLLSIQRKALLRISSGYRTISTSAVQVITGTPPITLLVEERHRLYHTENGSSTAAKNRERQVTLNKWQDMWNTHTETAAWTKAVIQDILPWDDTCVYCGDIDTEEHAILVCDRWSQWREELEEELNERIRTENIIGIMISSANNWGKYNAS